MVRVTGADARAFLHRLSTNHVSELAAGEGRLNVLTTDKGRIVDVIHHLDRGDAGLLLVGSAGKGAAIFAWLDRYLFSEKLTLEEVQWPCVEVTGPTDLAPWAFRELDGVITVRTFDRVDAAGARVPCVLVINDAAARGDIDSEVARIAAGVPGSGELIDKFNPLDIGMNDAIHWNKGCYIGQEVIARLDTYQKQHKVLATLTLSEEARARVAVGAAVLVDGAVVGEVTSVAPSTWGARPNALAVGKLAGRERAQVKLGDDTVDVIVGVPATAQPPHA